MSSTTCRLLYLVLFGSASVAEGALCQRPHGATRRVVADSCLQGSEFQLRGVFLNTDTTGALSGLGKVLRVRTDSGADDGGVYERQTFSYRDLELAVVRGEVDRLITHAPSVATPSGLKPGLGVEEVRRLLLSQGTTFGQGADTVDIADCEQPGGGDWIRLVFDRRRRVRTLEIFAARP